MSPGKRKVTIVGAGSWGTALGNVFADAGSPVVVWGRDATVVAAIDRKHENLKYLPGLPLNPALRATTDLEAALAEAAIVVCSIPTQQIRGLFGPHARLLHGKVVVNTSKGIEIGTHAGVSAIFRELVPSAAYLVLSGPSFAHEVARRLPTAVTLASEGKALASEIQALLFTQYFRAYTSPDVAGVELAGALKNVIAIASGMVTGLQLGYNAQAALINRGIAEVVRMARHRGADPLTFLGLSGVGDLILTCTGPLSRNRRLGVLLGEGKRLDDALATLGGVAEGLYTARSAWELSRALQVDTPIVEQIYGILYGDNTPRAAVATLMSRDLREELEQ